GRARRVIREGISGERALGAAAVALLDHALTRRVRVRRIRLAAWEDAARAEQLALWPDVVPDRGRAADFEAALDRLRRRRGTDALVPASWMALGVALRPSARP
ncbi:MAG TPA: hypothetical protein VL503_01540, partial [Candidatus Omnitrophota bacterium]|nr:hypothetical protein [Candidatus Omnitrophota bacterium]